MHCPLEYDIHAAALQRAINFVCSRFLPCGQHGRQVDLQPVVGQPGTIGQRLRTRCGSVIAATSAIARALSVWYSAANSSGSYRVGTMASRSSAERENGIPLPMQSAAGVAVIHGRITPSHTPVTAGVRLAAVRECPARERLCYFCSHSNRKLYYCQLSLRYFLGMFSKFLV